MLEALILAITIDIDPEIREFGGLLLTWHGVFTAAGIAIGVYAAVLMARTKGFIDDDVYSAALIGIPCGIIGARALYVAERWGDPGLDQVIDIFRINEGGISIYGAIIGGVIGIALYAWWRGYPVLRGLDILAFGGVLGMAVGRIGDIINGEHFAEQSSLPWAVKYTNLDSPALQGGNPIEECVRSGIQGMYCSYHPAVGYEMLADLLIFGLLFVILRYVRRDGLALSTMLFLYGLMRFGVSELRIDSKDVIWGLTTPQVTSLFMIGFGVLGLLYVWRRGETDETPQTGQGAPVAATGPPAAT